MNYVLQSLETELYGYNKLLKKIDEENDKSFFEFINNKIKYIEKAILNLSKQK